MKKVFRQVILTVAFSLLVTCCGKQAQSPAQSGKVQWIDPAKLKPGPIVNQTLPDDLIKRITAVHDVFAEVDPTPLDKWIEDFKRDMHPDREVSIWEAMGRAYVHYTADKSLSIEKKKELFGILLVGSGAPPDEAIKHLDLKEFSEAEAREALKFLTEEWKKEKAL